MVRRKVLLVELNEVTWDLIDPLIEQGKLPTFARLKRDGVWAAPMSVDMPPHLDPWITWTTVYTGRAQEDHNVYFHEQPAETIRAERVWELCARRGLRVGVRQPLFVAAAEGQRFLRAGDLCAGHINLPGVAQ